MSYTQYDERTSYVIPDGTEVIGDHAIAYCDNIKELIIHDSVKEYKAIRLLQWTLWKR